jgi:transcriptional regulator with XRE-family HTH domain
MYSRLIDARAFHAQRAAADLTMKELADLSGLSESMLKKVGRGLRELSDRSVIRVAKAMECRVDDFTVPKPDIADSIVDDFADSEAA